MNPSKQTLFYKSPAPLLIGNLPFQNFISSLHEYLQHELQENDFHEKSELREKVNEYMSEYISLNCDQDMQNKYEQFVNNILT